MLKNRRKIKKKRDEIFYAPIDAEYVQKCVLNCDKKQWHYHHVQLCGGCFAAVRFCRECRDKLDINDVPMDVW